MNKSSKYWPLLIGVIIVSLALHACEQDVDVFTTPKFTPVVYCLLNPQDSIQTVRVSRVFQDRKNLTDWEQTFDRYLNDTTKRIYIDPAIVPGRKMVIDPTQAYVIRWFGLPGTAYYQGIFHINYLEKRSGEIRSKTVSMPLSAVLQYPDESIFSQNVNGNYLLKTLKDSIPVLDSVSRKIVDLDFTFIYGGTELALFSNSGINPLGLSDRVSDFTNLDNARGVFSSISRLKVYGIPLSSQSADTIAMHNLTKNLNFIGSDEDF